MTDDPAVFSIDEIKRRVVPIARSFGVQRIYLFGSYARGSATACSDLDFRVDKGQVRGFAFGGLCNALGDAFGKPVDVVTTASLNEGFRQTIVDEEVLLYEQ